MIFKEWFKWIYNVPWSLKWFLLLILVRPVVDTLYFLKDVSIFLSPLIWIAALTPVLVFLSLTLGKKQSIKTGFSYIDLMMVIWVGVVLINTLQLYFEMDVLTASDIFLRSTIPYFIYFYSRYFMRSMRHLYFFVRSALFSDRKSVVLGMRLI